MAIDRIEVHEYEVMLGANRDEHFAWVEDINNQIRNKLININIRTIDLYNLSGGQQLHYAGDQQRMIIYSNATRSPNGANQRQIKFGNVNMTVDVYEPNNEGVTFTDDNGIPIAEYHEDHNELNILFNIFNVYNDNNIKAFGFILDVFERIILYPKTLVNSWLHTNRKDVLTDKLTKRFKEQHRREVMEDKDRMNRYSTSINEYKEKIKRSFDNMIRLRNKVEMEERNLSDVDTKIIKELDLIVTHDKISDLHIIGEKFIAYVPKVYAHSTTGERYYIGNMRIELNPENAEVNFFGDNGRNGYWSESDPHPHVDGRRGTPCLGSIGSTIAELASHNEIYALVLTCIDFLENANTSDPAGNKVIMWDQVDETGTVIREGGINEEEEKTECNCCGDMYPDDEIYGVYNEIDEDGDPAEHRNVCEACRTDDYTFNDNIDEFIHNDVEVDG